MNKISNEDMTTSLLAEQDDVNILINEEKSSLIPNSPHGKKMFGLDVENHDYHISEIVLIIAIPISIIFLILNIFLYIPGQIGAIALLGLSVYSALYIWNLQTQRDLQEVVETFQKEMNILENESKRFASSNKQLKHNTNLLVQKKQQLKGSNAKLQLNVSGLDDLEKELATILHKQKVQFSEREKVFGQLSAAVHTRDKLTLKRSMNDVIKRTFLQFTASDVDRDGKIEDGKEKEFMMIHLKESCIKWADEHDHDGDGNINKTELRKLIETHFEKLIVSLAEIPKLKQLEKDLKFELERYENDQEFKL